jgi:hypothetical protein
MVSRWHNVLWHKVSLWNGRYPLRFWQLRWTNYSASNSKLPSSICVSILYNNWLIRGHIEWPPWSPELTSTDSRTPFPRGWTRIVSPTTTVRDTGRRGLYNSWSPYSTTDWQLFEAPTCLRARTLVTFLPSLAFTNEASVALNSEKTQCIFLSREQNAGRTSTQNIANKHWNCGKIQVVWKDTKKAQFTCKNTLTLHTNWGMPAAILSRIVYLPVCCTSAQAIR